MLVKMMMIMIKKNEYEDTELQKKAILFVSKKCTQWQEQQCWLWHFQFQIHRNFGFSQKLLFFDMFPCIENLTLKKYNFGSSQNFLFGIDMRTINSIVE